MIGETIELDGKTYAKHEEIPFYEKQHRMVLHNCGTTDAEDINEYIARGGYAALEKALFHMTREQICQEISDSGLRGRGGGGFPAGRKWDSVRRQPKGKKYVVCNGDEGDPGAFMDRSVLEGDPFSVIEAMTIAGYTVGSSQGYIYYQYTSPTRYGRQASSGTAYRTSGSNLISDLTFVPRAGYSGTVTIPYTGSNSSGSTFEGELVITVTPSTSSAYFNDMGAYSDAQRAAVDYLRENGITNGISNTQYGPEHSITRADFAVMVYKAFGLTSTGGYVYFNDVPPNAYYAQAVNTLRAMGIVSGIGNGAYGSNYTLTRQDAICMVQRAMRAVGWSANDGLSSYLYGYSDGYDVSNYAQGAMAHAVQMGYLPISNGRLAPKNPLTRVDMAQIIHRVLTY